MRIGARWPKRGRQGPKAAARSESVGKKIGWLQGPPADLGSDLGGEGKRRLTARVRSWGARRPEQNFPSPPVAGETPEECYWRGDYLRPRPASSEAPPCEQHPGAGRGEGGRRGKELRSHSTTAARGAGKGALRWAGSAAPRTRQRVGAFACSRCRGHDPSIFGLGGDLSFLLPVPRTPGSGLNAARGPNPCCSEER